VGWRSGSSTVESSAFDRIGQTGCTCRRWFERGLPRGRRDLRPEAVYLFGAVCPDRDLGVALVLPEVSAAAMQAMLNELATAVTPGAHAVVILDRAGWHTAKGLAIPVDLTPVFLPPYAPELTALLARALPLAPAVANLRGCSRRLLLRAEPGRIRSLCSFDWLTPVRT
jgi:hypothetical protein